MKIYELLQSSWETASLRGKRCWVLDENFAALYQGTLRLQPSDYVITNRFDIFTSLQSAVASPHFCDFDFSVMGASDVQAILYRVSKERPVTHRILNQASQKLPHGGYLFLAGDKDEGIKNYVQKACKNLGFEGKTQKFGLHYLATLRKACDTQCTLDDKNYERFREIATDPLGRYISKPGVYGFNKIDQGSELLRKCLLEEVLPRVAEEKKNTAIDLGCGYGYLSLALHHGGIKNLFATDNNSAALAATTQTLQQNGCLNFKVNAGDAGDCYTRPADLVVCNPPFHQGFSVESELTEKFVSSAARLTAHHGRALFVVNAFIPLEKVTNRYFHRAVTLQNNRRFKVIELLHKARQ